MNAPDSPKRRQPVKKKRKFFQEFTLTSPSSLALPRNTSSSFRNINLIPFRHRADSTWIKELTYALGPSNP
ncbi:UNKNOWN [Stylonychia lemnae]|uniref:Uncharacterized protein n=1 Tax=Stylonychia lemnae TaxID=5949 RepID=A0A078AK92_STYLE|nr:UNKNOWN [Stylonychia lemnae]|eukprot:CDW82800.1 UNKNOWN [Stylonychia lemnae]